jgi:hypothetical protein
MSSTRKAAVDGGPRPLHQRTTSECTAGWREAGSVFIPDLPTRVLSARSYNSGTVMLTIRLPLLSATNSTPSELMTMPWGASTDLSFSRIVVCCPSAWPLAESGMACTELEEASVPRSVSLSTSRHSTGASNRHPDTVSPATLSKQRVRTQDPQNETVGS